MEKRVLIVEAHPDDIEWYAGGTVARLAKEGAAVSLVVCTEGERGSYNPDDNPIVLAQTRKREQQAAADLLGVREVAYLGYPDGGLEATRELRRQLALLYREKRPDLLLAFDPWKRYELHPDHLAAGRAAVEARMFAKMPLYYADQPQEGIEAWAIPELWLFNTDEPNHYVDVTDTFEVRLQALRLFTSQNVWGPDSVEFLTESVKSAGEKSGCRYAEGFYRITIEGAIARS